MSNANPIAFMSYAHADDERDRNYLTRLRQALSAEMTAQTGDSFDIFQDRKDIHWGQQWKTRIDESLDAATFLIAIVTPSYLRSGPCREEFERFLSRESALGRHDLILPIYYIECPELRKGADTTDPIAQELRKRHWVDWRLLRGKDFSTQRVDMAVRQLAVEIRDSLARPTSSSDEPSSTFHLAQAGRSQPEFLAPSGDMPAAMVELEYGPPFDDSLLGGPRFYVGRSEQLEWLVTHLQSPGSAIAAINGMPGIGKTTLASLAVSRLHEMGIFPDGVAVVQCQGIGSAMELAQTILSRFDPYRRTPDIKRHVELPDLMRRVIGNKRSLVVLDGIGPDLDASSVIRALRGSGASILITSQSLLPSDVVSVDARLLLDPLPSAEAIELVTHGLGRTADAGAFSAAEFNSIQDIVTALDGHPLALELVAAYTADLNLDLTTVAGEVREPGHALSLRRGETPTTLGVVFSRTYEALPPDAKRTFTALAGFRRLEVGREAAITMAKAIGVAEAEAALNSLVFRSLVRGVINREMPAGSDRQRTQLHPLVYAYAEEQLRNLSLEDQYAVHHAIAQHYLKYLVSVYATAPYASDNPRGSCKTVVSLDPYRCRRFLS